MFGVARVLIPFVPLILLLAPSSVFSRRSGFFVSLDVASNASSELSALVARELAMEDPDRVFASSIFRDLSLPARSVRFIVQAFSEASFSEEQVAFYEKAPNVAHMVQLIRSDAPLLFPTLLWVRAKMLNDAGEISFSKLHAAICAYDQPANFWPTHRDLGCWCLKLICSIPSRLPHLCLRLT